MDMRKTKKLLFVFLRIFLLLILFFLIISAAFYLLCPVYIFEEPAPFSGEHIFNPYARASFTNWGKASMHTHTTASDGKNTAKEVFDAYHRFGYEIVAITDHSKVTSSLYPSGEEIPSYEHGINISLFHSVNIGTRKTILRDYFFVNSISHKYDKLKLMNESADVVFLAHPHKTKWLSPDDLKYLNNYRYMEISWSGNQGKQTFLDAALSAGHPVFVAATDDCHDVNIPSRFARTAMFIDTETGCYDEIRGALLDGRSYSMTIPDFLDAEYKLKRSLNLPGLKSVVVKNDSTICKFSEPGIIRVYGQNGKLIHSVSGNTDIKVPFRAEDNYLRFTAEFSDGIIIYTNPVYRYTKNGFGNTNLASVNYPLTFVQTIALSALLVLLSRTFVSVLLRLLSGRIIVWICKYRIMTNICVKAQYQSV